MTDVERARDLFTEAGLAFPMIPENLALRLEEKGPWLFSTRECELGREDYLHPYWLRAYVDEAAEKEVDDYVVLAHGGHGINSYAIQYYVVYENLRLFLHLGWGGVYMDPKEAADQITECFDLADKIVSASEAGTVSWRETLTIVGSDFYGSYWHLGGGRPPEHDDDLRRPVDVLTEALHWINSSI